MLTNNLCLKYFRRRKREQGETPRGTRRQEGGLAWEVTTQLEGLFDVVKIKATVVAHWDENLDLMALME